MNIKFSLLKQFFIWIKSGIGKVYFSEQKIPTRQKKVSIDN